MWRVPQAGISVAASTGAFGRYFRRVTTTSEMRTKPKIARCLPPGFALKETAERKQRASWLVPQGKGPRHRAGIRTTLCLLAATAAVAGKLLHDRVQRSRQATELTASIEQTINELEDLRRTRLWERDRHRRQILELAHRVRVTADPQSRNALRLELLALLASENAADRKCERKRIGLLDSLRSELAAVNHLGTANVRCEGLLSLGIRLREVIDRAEPVKQRFFKTPEIIENRVFANHDWIEPLHLLDHRIDATHVQRDDGAELRGVIAEINGLIQQLLHEDTALRFERAAILTATRRVMELTSQDPRSSASRRESVMTDRCG